MKKTVIQSLIEKFNSGKKELPVKDIITILENSLNDEKKQIMDAFDEGVDYEKSLLGKVDYPSSRYYHGTFENNKK
jgi:hypothetical protein